MSRQNRQASRRYPTRLTIRYEPGRLPDGACARYEPYRSGQTRSIRVAERISQCTRGLHAHLGADVETFMAPRSSLRQPGITVVVGDWPRVCHKTAGTSHETRSVHAWVGRSFTPRQRTASGRNVLARRRHACIGSTLGRQWSQLLITRTRLARWRTWARREVDCSRTGHPLAGQSDGASRLRD